MIKWHKDQADVSKQRHASVADGAQGDSKVGGNTRKKPAVEESRK